MSLLAEATTLLPLFTSILKLRSFPSTVVAIPPAFLSMCRTEGKCAQSNGLRLMQDSNAPDDTQQTSSENAPNLLNTFAAESASFTSLGSTDIEASSISLMVEVLISFVHSRNISVSVENNISVSIIDNGDYGLLVRIIEERYCS